MQKYQIVISTVEDSRLTLTVAVLISARQRRKAFSSVYVGRRQLMANSRWTTSKSSANLAATVSTMTDDVSLTVAATSACVATITTRGLDNSLPAKPSHTHRHRVVSCEISGWEISRIRKIQKNPISTLYRPKYQSLFDTLSVSCVSKLVKVAIIIIIAVVVG